MMSPWAVCRSTVPSAPFISVSHRPMTRLPIFLAIVVLGFLAGCDSTEPQAEVVLEPGATRLYAFRSTLTDPTGAVSTLLIDTIRAHVVATGRSVEGMDGLTELEYQSLVTGGSARTWYRQEIGQLVEVAYDENFLAVTAQLRVDPAVVSRPLRLLAGAVMGGGDGDGVRVREEPRIVLNYPLEPGRAWVSFSHPFLSERRVERIESIDVPAGAFETVVVSTTIDVAPDGHEWLDWLDDGGLVQRRISFEFEFTDSNGSILGTGTQLDEAILIAVE